MEKWATNSFHLTNDKIKSWKANNTDTSSFLSTFKSTFKKRKKREEETLLLALVIQSGTSILE